MRIISRGTFPKMSKTAKIARAFDAPARPIFAAAHFEYICLEAL